MASEYIIEQAFASVNQPLRVPCWNILSIGHGGGGYSLDVHCRVVLRKRVSSYCTVSLRALLSKPFVTYTLSCRCRGVGSELGVRFGFGFGLVLRLGLGLRLVLFVRMRSSLSSLTRPCFAHTFSRVLPCGFVLPTTRQNSTRQKRPHTPNPSPFYCQTCSRPTTSRLLPSCVHLSAS